jgi:hypothetical protein
MFDEKKQSQKISWHCPFKAHIGAVEPHSRAVNAHFAAVVAHPGTVVGPTDPEAMVAQ